MPSRRFAGPGDGFGSGQTVMERSLPWVVGWSAGTSSSIGCVRRFLRRRIHLSERRRLGVDSPLPGGERETLRYLRRGSFDHGRAAVPTATGLPRGKCDTSTGAHLTGTCYLLSALLHCDECGSHPNLACRTGAVRRGYVRRPETMRRHACLPAAPADLHPAHRGNRKRRRHLLHTPFSVIGISSAPNGIRIHVAALKGLCPRPLDDGGKRREFYPKTHTGSNRAHHAPRAVERTGSLGSARRRSPC